MRSFKSKPRLAFAQTTINQIMRLILSIILSPSKNINFVGTVKKNKQTKKLRYITFIEEIPKRRLRKICQLWGEERTSYNCCVNLIFPASINGTSQTIGNLIQILPPWWNYTRPLQSHQTPQKELIAWTRFYLLHFQSIPGALPTKAILSVYLPAQAGLSRHET